MISQHGTLEISRSRMRHNLAVLRRKLAPNALICPIIKAEAYGHGIEPITQCFAGEPIQWVCVYGLNEVDSLPKNHAFKILVLAPLILQQRISNPSLIDRLLHLCGHEIRVNITDHKTATLLSDNITSSRRGRPYPIHLQIDTGLTRCGVSITDAPQLIKQILHLPHLHLEGIFTHLSHGDAPGHPTIADQIAVLHKIADPIKREHPEILIHAQNSGGIFNYSDASLDMVRIGIALYGLQPSLDDPIPGLQPIARLVAPILMIHERPANTGVGYGHTFTTQRPSRLAIVPVGYADGYPRALSNRGIVQIRGQNAPVVGRVSMDQIIIDVTDIPSAAPGDEVTVFSNDPTAPNCIDQIAKACGTIGYEIATGMGPRLARRIVD